jgi:hypothetical protein
MRKKRECYCTLLGGTLHAGRDEDDGRAYLENLNTKGCGLRILMSDAELADVIKKLSALVKAA